MPAGHALPPSPHPPPPPPHIDFCGAFISILFGIPLSLPLCSICPPSSYYHTAPHHTTPHHTTPHHTTPEAEAVIAGLIGYRVSVPLLSVVSVVVVTSVCQPLFSFFLFSYRSLLNATCMRLSLSIALQDIQATEDVIAQAKELLDTNKYTAGSARRVKTDSSRS